MKNSIIYLGLALVTLFQNANAETTLVKGVSTNSNIAAAVKADQYQKSLLGEIVVGNNKKAPVEDAAIVNPSTVIASSTQKTVEEIIAEDRKITESNITNDGILYFSEKTTEEIIAADNQIIESSSAQEIQLLFIEKSIEDQIAADNSITESNVPTEAQALDFDLINRNSVLVKQTKNKQIVGMN
ncbi:hypothetical protein FNO01nite_17870 [Flavobacterium noncentrifugens]|uniref:Uncharacterized protein n=1 Tax=Flavobacterium noncentrifugens TaxID=1128970 RepID=A0A1G8X0G2_9FLAO|nr:hypothetical protein [Flavobacterium noncentrifugens]GEP51115.1 hypothetical protein FNO01nite_17870 [Flavobacterium noncentrifugens]SDJ84129.1 hypothetical protein SAMN04487935_2016 [Flavobacterium noncentrifugens]